MILMTGLATLLKTDAPNTTLADPRFHLPFDPVGPQLIARAGDQAVACTRCLTLSINNERDQNQVWKRKSSQHSVSILSPSMGQVMSLLSIAYVGSATLQSGTPPLPIRGDTYFWARTVNKKLSASARLSLAFGLCVRLAGKGAEVSPRCNLPQRRSLLFL